VGHSLDNQTDIQEINNKKKKKHDFAEEAKTIGQYTEDDKEQDIDSQSYIVIGDLSLGKADKNPGIFSPEKGKTGEDRASEGVFVGKFHQASQKLTATTK
jgi:hypothetical protein